VVLYFFLGFLGVHRFYLGKIVSGIFMLLILGGLGLWAFVDMLNILFSNFKDSNDHPFANKNT
jgi:TM2 domain-containing membrane protein YozV